MITHNYQSHFTRHQLLDLSLNIANKPTPSVSQTSTSHANEHISIYKNLIVNTPSILCWYALLFLFCTSTSILSFYHRFLLLFWCRLFLYCTALFSVFLSFFCIVVDALCSLYFSCVSGASFLSLLVSVSILFYIVSLFICVSASLI